MIKYKLNKELAEETGIHIGDGSMNIYKGNQCLYTVACHWKDDKEYIDDHVLKLVKNIYGKTPKPREWSKGTYGFRICSKNIICFKNKELGLPLGKKIGIDVPISIKKNDILMRYLIRGLFDTDGSLTLWKTNNKLYPRIYFSSISKKLVDTIREHLTIKGFRVTYWETTPKEEKWSKIYKISINGHNMLAKWVNDIGFKNQKNLKKLDRLGVKYKIL